MADGQQQPANPLDEQTYLAFMGMITGAMFRDIQVAKQLAVKAFGADVKPEIVLMVYDRILERIPQPEDEAGEGEG